MTLQAKLTLGTVLLATGLVAIISAIYLGRIMDLRYADVLVEATNVRDIAVQHVKDAVNSQPQKPPSESLASDSLSQLLVTEVANHKEIVEVAVADAAGDILSDSF